MFLIKCAAILIAALLLGKWFDNERNNILAKGEPWYNAWKTIPGILILVILCILIFIKIAFDL
ncbi:hypothetical protein BuS5_03442 [Desulfosarcina sp. BuS5]|uniref:hypothetical protein n=1 Tax=Desulfosarcina sp. BuS5 TaxID=933262 RepID=UPI0004832E24|nr:hypothetical protein [Desulfosarcina sp. BuS5]WDN90471.1 hypothetical protein BuS5_03442 [Desulfosarcina sp. BuS5]